MREIDHYYFSKEEPNQSCLLALRDIIKEYVPELEETIKYGIPCFLLKKKMFCYLNIYQKTGEPYILWVDGHLLEHPDLEQGDRKRMKILRVNPSRDIQLQKIHSILEQALEIRRSR